MEELTCNMQTRKRVAKQSRGKDEHRRLGRSWVLRLRLDSERKETARCVVVGLVLSLRGVWEMWEISGVRCCA